MHRWIAVLVAIAAVIVAAPTATAAPPDPPEQCRVNQPPGLWPSDYIDLGSGEWDTNLHHGLNSDFTKQVRPIGRVKALMIFVDFSDAPARPPTPTRAGATGVSRSPIGTSSSSPSTSSTRAPTGASSST